MVENTELFTIVDSTELAELPMVVESTNCLEWKAKKPDNMNMYQNSNQGRISHLNISSHAPSCIRKYSILYFLISL